MGIEYAVIYLGNASKEAEESLNAFASAGWKVLCSCATNRVILSRETSSMEMSIEEEQSDHEQLIELYVKELEESEKHGVEEGHMLADELLTDLLKVLGYGEVAEKFISLKKWYS